MPNPSSTIPAILVALLNTWNYTPPVSHILTGRQSVQDANADITVALLFICLKPPYHQSLTKKTE